VRKSGVVSTTKVVVSLSTRMLLLSLLSFSFSEVQIAQLQAIMGTPPLVPVPKKVIRRSG
jgi:hypothetical protein